MHFPKHAILATLVMSALAGCNHDTAAATQPAPEKAPEKVAPVVDNTTLKSDVAEVIQKGQGSDQLDTVTVQLAATSDLHGRLFGFDYATNREDTDAGLTRVATLIDQQRAKNPNLILVDIGDAVQGNSALLFNDYDTHPMVAALNELKYDVWVPGNHEFNFDRSFLDRNVQNFNGSVISANIKWESNNRGYLKSYQMFNVQGVKVALVGLSPSNIPNWEASNPAHFKGLKFENEVKATGEALASLKAKYHPDVIVGAFHASREMQGVGVYDIAAKFADQFDVILAGHEHAQYIEQVNKGVAKGQSIAINNADFTQMTENTQYNETNRHDMVKIMEPGKWGWALASANITMHKNAQGQWEMQNATLSNLKTDSANKQGVPRVVVPQQKALSDSFNFVQQQSVADATQELGKVEGDFIAGGGADLATNEDATNGRLYSLIHKAKVQDTALMDFLHKVQLDHVKGAVVSAASLFSDKTNLRDGQVYSKGTSSVLYLYDNTLMGVNMTGAHLKQFMEWSYSYFNTYKPGDLTYSFSAGVPAYNYDQFGGDIQFTVDLSKPVGARIAITEIAGKAFDPAATYKVAMNNYRFGTHAQSKGWATADDVFYQSNDEAIYAIRDMLTDYVAKHNGVKASNFAADNNWHFIQDDAMKALRQTQGKALWQQLQHKQICVVTAGSSAKGITITQSINVNDPSSYTANATQTLAGCK